MKGTVKRIQFVFCSRYLTRFVFLYIRSNCFICLFLFALFPFYVLCGLCLWNRSRSGLLWCQADRALGHIQNGGSESPCGCSCRHPRSRHLSWKRQSEERQVLCKTWSPNERSLLAIVEAWNASNLTATNFQKYQIKLLVFEHFFQDKYLIKLFLILSKHILLWS